MARNDTVIIGAIIIVVILVAGGLAYTQAPRFWDALDKAWTETFGDVGDSNGVNATDGESAFLGGSGYVGATIRYTDGSQRSFRLTENQMLPMYIQDVSGEVIQSITVEVWMTVEYTGDLTAWSAVGSTTLDISYGSIVEHSGDTRALGASGTSFVSGESTKIWEHTWQASTLEAWFISIAEGDPWHDSNLRYRVTCDSTFTWTDGYEETVSLNAESIHLVRWMDEPADPRITSISISIQPSRVHY